MANFTIPNLCGASPELNLASTKIADLENEILSKIDAAASEAAAAFDTALADVKDGLDGLALDLPEVPNVNFQAEITSLINDIDRTSIEGLAAFNIKLAQLELDFGNTLKEKGLSSSTLVVAPVPDANYSAELNYLFKPNSLVTDTTGTWLSNNARNLLLYGCLLEGYTFMKGDPDMFQVYEARYQQELARLKNRAEGRSRRDEYRADSLRTTVT